MDESDGQQAVTAPRVAWELGAALADHRVPVDGRDGVAVAQFLRMSADRALERVNFLRMVERRAEVALWRTSGQSRRHGPGSAGR